MAKGVCKKGKSMVLINPQVIEKQNSVKALKKKDVNMLLTSHYGPEWRNDTDLAFYRNIIDGTENSEAHEELCEQQENTTELFI